MGDINLREFDKTPWIVINIDKKFILRSLAFFFILLGITFAIFSGNYCRGLCDLCDNQTIKPCSLLGIFVGITLINVGVALVMLKVEKIGIVEI